MATWQVKIFPYNILELGTVDVTGDADFGYPESRLYDRATSLFWKDTVTEAKNFTVDQGAASILDVDFLAVTRHNFSGADLQWQYSSDDFSADVNDAVTDWTQGDNEQIVKTLASAVNSRYWRLTLSSMANPQCSEIYMSKAYSFNVLREPYPRGQDIANVEWRATVGGIDRSTKFGDKRRLKTYSFWLDATQWSSFQTVIGYLNDYAKPFYFMDHAENYYHARFQAQPQFDFNHNTHVLINAEIIEMI